MLSSRAVSLLPRLSGFRLSLSVLPVHGLHAPTRRVPLGFPWGTAATALFHTTPLLLMAEEKDSEQQRELEESMQRESSASGSGAVSGGTRRYSPATPYNQRMQKAVDENQFQECYRIFDEMVAAGVTPNVGSVNTVANAHARNGEARACLELLERSFSEFKVVPNALVLNSALRSCIAGPDLKTSATIFSLFEKHDVEPTGSTYAFLISTHARGGSMHRAMDYLNTMKELGMKLNDSTFGILIRNAIRLNAIRIVSAILEQAIVDKPVLDLATVYNALTMCARERDAHATRMAYGIFRQQFADSQLDRGLWLQLFDTVYARSDSELLQMLLQDCPAELLRTSSALSEAAAAAHAACGHWKEAWSCVFGASHNMKDSQDALVPLMRAAANAGVDGVDQAYFALLDVAPRPVPAACMDAIVLGCALLGDVERAFATFQEYAAVGAAPDAHSYAFLIEAAVSARQMGTVHRLMQEMSQKGFVPSDRTYISVATAYGRADRVDKIDAMITELEGSRGKAPLPFYRLLVSKLARLGQDITPAVERAVNAGYDRQTLVLVAEKSKAATQRQAFRRSRSEIGSAATSPDGADEQPAYGGRRRGGTGEYHRRRPGSGRERSERRRRGDFADGWRQEGTSGNPQHE